MMLVQACEHLAAQAHWRLPRTLLPLTFSTFRLCKLAQVAGTCQHLAFFHISSEGWERVGWEAVSASAGAHRGQDVRR